MELAKLELQNINLTENSGTLKKLNIKINFEAINLLENLI